MTLAISVCEAHVLEKPLPWSSYYCVHAGLIYGGSVTWWMGRSSSF